MRFSQIASDYFNFAKLKEFERVNLHNDADGRIDIFDCFKKLS